VAASRRVSDDSDSLVRDADAEVDKPMCCERSLASYETFTFSAELTSFCPVFSWSVGAVAAERPLKSDFDSAFGEYSVLQCARVVSFCGLYGSAAQKVESKEAMDLFFLLVDTKEERGRNNLR